MDPLDAGSSSPSPLTRRLTQTLLICMGVFMDGFNEGTVAATLPELAFITSSSTDAIATLLTWRNVAGMAGSIVIGKAMERLDGLLVLGVSLLGQAVFMLLIPWSSSLLGMSFLNALSAFFVGGITAGSYVVVYDVWRHNMGAARSITQLQGVFFILGSALAPITVSPFLGVNYPPSANQTELNITISEKTIPVATLFTDALYLPWLGQRNVVLDSNSTVVKGSTKVAIAYLLAATLTAVFGLLSCLVVGIFHCTTTTTSTPTTSTGTESASSSSTSQEVEVDVKECINKPSLIRTKEVVVPYAFYLVFMILYGGFEYTTSGLLVTYTQSFLGWDVTKSALSATVFQSARFVTVLLSIVLVHYIQPYSVVILDLIVIIIGAGAWLIFYKFTVPATWVGITLVGIGSANVFATSFSIGDSISPISGTVAGLFNMTYCLGGLTFPPLAGYLLEHFPSWSFPLLMLVSIVVCLIFVLLSKLSLMILRRPREGTEREALLSAEVAGDSEGQVD